MRTKQTTVIEITTILWTGLLAVIIVSLLVMSPEPLEAKSKKTTLTAVATLPTQGTITKVYDGDTITIASGGQTFKCRLLVYVSMGGQDINAFMLTNGLAVAETRFSYDRLEAYIKLWRAAQKQRVGMWTAIPVPEALPVTK